MSLHVACIFALSNPPQMCKAYITQIYIFLIFLYFCISLRTVKDSFTEYTAREN